VVHSTGASPAAYTSGGLVAVDRIPGARERRAWNREDNKDAKLEHKPLLVMDSDMNTLLIEGPSS
jgi:hypothetical protein